MNFIVLTLLDELHNLFFLWLRLLLITLNELFTWFCKFLCFSYPTFSSSKGYLKILSSSDLNSALWKLSISSNDTLNLSSSWICSCSCVSNFIFLKWSIHDLRVHNISKFTWECESEKLTFSFVIVFHTLATLISWSEDVRNHPPIFRNINIYSSPNQNTCGYACNIFCWTSPYKISSKAASINGEYKNRIWCHKYEEGRTISWT